MNAARECRANICYYVANVDYIQYIGGLKPIGEGVIFICLHLQQMLVGYEPRHYRRDGHHLLRNYSYINTSSNARLLVVNLTHLSAPTKNLERLRTNGFC
jgi:hypothetical protein